MGETALNLEEEVKRDNKKVAGWLLFYHERKRECLEERQTVLDSSPPRIDETARYGQGSVTDSTGRKAAKLADMAAWIDLIEEVERRLPPKQRIFLRLRREYRYAVGRNGWTAAVQWRYAEEVAKMEKKRVEDVWVNSRNTFTQWWNRIVNYATVEAARRRLI